MHLLTNKFTKKMRELEFGKCEWHSRRCRTLISEAVNSTLFTVANFASASEILMLKKCTKISVCLV